MKNCILSYVWLFIRKAFSFLEKLKRKSIYFFYYEKYEISPDFKILGSNVEFYGDGQIFIGKNGYCGNLVSLQAVSGKKIKIGDNVAISHNVRIYTSNRDAKDFLRGEAASYRSGDVSIGDDVWIGANVFIVEGVEIGDRVVIGANSVVTKSVSSGTVVAGSPARVVYEVKL